MTSKLTDSSEQSAFSIIPRFLRFRELAVKSGLQKKDRGFFFSMQLKLAEVIKMEDYKVAELVDLLGDADDQEAGLMLELLEESVTA